MASPNRSHKRQKIRELAGDFPRLWQDPRTPSRERKRMARLLIEDVTLLKGELITVHVRFRGGATRTIQLPLLLGAPEARRTPRQVVEEIDRLLDQHTEEGVAAELNARGFRTGTGQPFDGQLVRYIRYIYQLKDRYARLREAGRAKTGNRPAHSLVLAPPGITSGNSLR